MGVAKANELIKLFKYQGTLGIFIKDCQIPLSYAALRTANKFICDVL